MNGVVMYTDPGTGNRHPLDEVQLGNFRELVEQGIHHEDAATVAYLMDALDEDQPVIDWSRILLNAREAGALLGVTAGWVTDQSKNRDRPAWIACVVKAMGKTMVWRMWSRGRISALESGAIN